MGTSSNVDLVLRAFDAVNSRDIHALAEVTHEDMTFYPAFTGGGLLEGAVWRGHAGFVEFLAEQDETWSDISFTVEDARDVGDRVLTRNSIHVVGRESGVDLQQTSWGVFRIDDGRISEGRIFATEAEATQAAGVPG